MDLPAFIEKWAHCAGGAERGNAPLYLVELLTALGLPTPDPASAETRDNDYVFERAVRGSLDGLGHPRRIDLYKRGCFVLEAKQSRWIGPKAAPFEDGPPQPDLLQAHGGRVWDALMRNARAQAKSYVADLPSDHATPPFIIICDVARSFELWADFTGTGRGYAPFPDRNRFRFTHAELAQPAIQDRLKAIWTDPASLDPTRTAAAVTRDIIDELVVVSRALERQGHDPEAVAHFLMRCIFTIFAADVGLIDKAKLASLFEDCIRSPGSFVPMFTDLWAKFDDPDHAGRFYSGFSCYLPHINGGLFADARAFPLGAAELRRLLIAARHDWRRVEPAIFGALLEHALQPAERRRLGAHYTPRRYVERLVELTVMEPLRADWRRVLTRIEQARDEGDGRGAVRIARGFHADLCRIRVLDPACGTGNFLYVCLELMKRLEDEVLETLTDLGETDRLGLETISPRQFIGIEINPRAAAIAELVLWIGFLQQHYRSHSGHPAEPILRAHGNIQHRDAVLDWDGAPEVIFQHADNGPRQVWPNPRRPAWPDADFIVGNPPFIGGKDLRSRLHEGYAEALWSAHPQMNDAADFVMYWWDHAAAILTQPGSPLRRFGFVTTNSITQVFQRRTLDRHLSGPRPLSLIYAVPDHPWTRATRDSAAVRIAMTVAEAGVREGALMRVASETHLDTDTPVIAMTSTSGRINADLSIGADASRAAALRANAGLCSPGVKLHGSGFIVSPAKAAELGLGRVQDLGAHIRPYRNGRDLTGHSRDALVIDLFGLERQDVRERFPAVYAHLVETVKEARDDDGRPIGRDVNPRPAYRDNWWIFGEPRADLRPALDGLTRYIATVETAKHRVFQFLDASILPDNMLVCVASDDPAVLAILSSRWHTEWCRARGGKLEDRPRYTKTGCFDPFPFPPAGPAWSRLAAAGEALNDTRRRMLDENPDLTLTGLYNLLEGSRAGHLTTRQEEQARRTQIVILRELHDEIDQLAAAAWGWVNQQDAVAALAALNRVRAEEERRGQVRWLRPEIQRGRAGGAARGVDAPEMVFTQSDRRSGRPAFPSERYEQPLALQLALSQLGGPAAPRDLARRFSGSVRLSRIDRVLTTLHRYGHVERLDDGRWISARG
ncbi:class I SAM-dependent DNA methyltransferase [Brevundimonas sp. NPDC092305]|uniref:class I SAM-dependent DNA methyltransferase n=1 Tax=Brevundimonas sp. NPDC092305 TaxID=3363957 RepID=UPI00381B155F